MCAHREGHRPATDASSCDLCGLPVIGRPLRDGEHDFCCEGCRRVFSAAQASGISDLLHTDKDRRVRAADASRRRATAAAAAGARRETLRVGGMWCASCATVLEDALLGLPGVLDAEVSYAAALARVTWEPAALVREDVLERVRVLGYGAEPARLAEVGAQGTEDTFLRFFVGAALSMWIMWPTIFLLYPAFVAGEYASVRHVSAFAGLLALPVLLYCGWPFLIGSWRALKVGRATMDTLVALGTWTAFAYSWWATLAGSGPTYFESAAMITTIVLLGRWIESMGRRDAERSLAALAATQAAEEAWLLGEDGALSSAKRIALAELEPGALVAVRPGERVPVDGDVVSGESELDRARLTGEPVPAPAKAGDAVWAGAINLTGTIVVRAARVGADTLSGRLAAFAEDAVFAKSQAQRLADKAAGAFVPLVLATAAATLLITSASHGVAEGVSRAVAVLVVACPCALGLATPLAVVNAISAGAKRGLLIRGGTALEQAGEIRAVAFDKTGTVTYGALSVAALITAEGAGAGAGVGTDGGASNVAHGPAAADELLAVAAAIETGDPHPAAAAIEAAARAAGIGIREASSVERVAGRGLRGSVGAAHGVAGNDALLRDEGVELPDALAQRAAPERNAGRIVVWVASGGTLLGGIVLADAVREEARETIERLSHGGVVTALVSGDSQATTTAVAQTAGIDDAFGDVPPHEKERTVREWAEALPGGDAGVAFVGDGVNDAAALAGADLAVTVADASDVAQLAADVVLTSADRPLASLPALLSIARSSRRVIRENLVWAFSYNAVTLPLAVLGLLSPIAAATAMALSSLAVVGNSLRVRLADRVR